MVLQVSLHWNLVAEKVLSKGSKNEGFEGDEEGDYGYKEGADHQQHQLFIKLDELQGNNWMEKARWVKRLY